LPSAEFSTFEIVARYNVVDEPYSDSYVSHSVPKIPIGGFV